MNAPHRADGPPRPSPALTPAETRSILIGRVAVMLLAACLGLALACLVLLEERPLQDAAGVKRDA